MKKLISGIKKLFGWMKKLFWLARALFWVVMDGGYNGGDAVERAKDLAFNNYPLMSPKEEYEQRYKGAKR